MQKVIENLLNQISKNAVIISEKSLLDFIIKYSGGLYSYRLKTYEELKDDILNSVKTSDIIKYALNNNVSYELAKTLLTSASLLPLETKTLHDLYKIKLKYLSSDVLNQDMIIDFYKSQEVVFIDYYNDDDYINNIISLISNNNIKYLYTKDYKTSYINKVLSFNNYYDEVMSVVNEINQYLNETDKSIVINTLDDEYMIILKEAFKIYNISYNYKNQSSIYSLNITKDIINNLFIDLSSNNSILSKFNDLVSNMSLNNISTIVVKKIKDVLSNFVRLDLSGVSSDTLKQLVIDCIKDNKVSLNETKVARVTIENVFKNHYDNNTIIYVLNFNQDVVPKTIKDDKYITDEDITEINKVSSFKLLSSVEKNIKRKSKYLDYIKYNDIHLSYSLKTPSKELVPSSLIKTLESSVNVISDNNIKYNINNKTNIFINYKKAVDSYNLYKLKSENLNVLSYLVKDKIKEELKTFDPSFKGGFKFNGTLNLSYTNLSDYLSCAYKFYLKYVLKIKKEEFETNSKLTLKVGNILHHILETNNKVLSLDEMYDQAINYANSCKYTLDNKELLYLKKFLSEFKVVYEDILRFEKATNYKVYAKEKRFEVDLLNNMKFVGKVDKIYQNDNFYSVVDYKSKDVKFDLRDIIHGVDLQLPVYVYLIKHCISDSDIQGIYLQSILRSSVIKDYTSIEDFIRSKDRLNGVVNLNRQEVENFDPNFDNEYKMYNTKVVKRDYTYQSSFLEKGFESSDFEAMKKFVEEVIFESSDKISHAKFDINPFVTTQNHDSCTYCEYKDICFIKSYLKKEKKSLESMSEVKDFLRENYGI